MLSAEISNPDNNGGALQTTPFANAGNTTIWAPTFYDPFQVKHRRRTSKKQFSILEKAFNENPKPNTATRRDLAEKLKMTVRGVQVWFQNRRAKDKAQKLKMAKKNGSTVVSSPTESEKTVTVNDNSTEVSIESSSEFTSKKESTESIAESITESITETNVSVSSPIAVKDLKEESKSTIDFDNKFKIDKDYSLLSNPYFQVEDGNSQDVVSLTDSASDYLQDAALNQSFGPAPLPTDFYGPFNMNRMNKRTRAKSLPNIFNLGGMYLPQEQQQLATPINQTFPFHSFHQPPQLSNQVPPYSPQSLQFLRQTPPYSTTSSPSLSSENGSHTRLSAGLARHPDLFYDDIDSTGINRGRGYLNYMASPGFSDNIPSPHSTTSNGYSPSYQSFIPDVPSINGIRPIDDSFGYMNNPYNYVQPILNNTYIGDIGSFVPDFNTGVGVLPGLQTYPSGFNPGRRSSCPPEFFSSVGNYQLLLDENLAKQKGLETIKEDEGIEEEEKGNEIRK